MIIRQKKDSFIMVRQHDHAYVSGEIAKHVKKKFFLDPKYIREVTLAIYEHDRSWIDLDVTPIWNDRDHVPYSFHDYPLMPKLLFYTKGIDEVEQKEAYAGLLCSKHYASFFLTSNQADCQKFLRREKEREQKLLGKLGYEAQVVEHHLQLLKLCDDISLYLCLNESGVSKTEEHPWYREGFAGSERFSDSSGLLKAEWTDQQQIEVRGNPFQASFTTSLKYKQVAKKQIKEIGIDQAYHQSAWQEARFSIVNQRREKQ